MWPPLKSKERAEMLEFTTKPMNEMLTTTTWAKSFERSMDHVPPHVGHTESCGCVTRALQVRLLFTHAMESWISR